MVGALKVCRFVAMLSKEFVQEMCSVLFHIYFALKHWHHDIDFLLAMTHSEFLFSNDIL